MAKNTFSSVSDTSQGITPSKTLCVYVCVRACVCVEVIVCDYVKDTVAKKREYDEEHRGDHSLVNASLRLDPIIHHHIPVLTCEDLTHTRHVRLHHFMKFITHIRTRTHTFPSPETQS